MHPVILRLGPLVIYSYGVWIAIGLFLGLILALRAAKQEGISQQVLFDLIFWLLVFGILGARFLYVAFDFPYFKSRPLEVIQIWKGGFVFYGGLLFSLLAGSFYIQRHHLNFGKIADLIAPSLALGGGIGRFGCFFAGC
jgi:phosphatidylglycerol:prolipoprotein diacylglycerol transferase